MLSEAWRYAAAAKKERADRYSANVLPVIREIQKSGVKTLRGVARALTARGVPTARGGAWTPVQVRSILQRVSQSRGTATLGFPADMEFASQLQSKKGIARLSLVKRCTHPLTGYVKQPLPKLGHGLANDMVVHTILTFLPKNAMWREVGQML